LRLVLHKHRQLTWSPLVSRLLARPSPLPFTRLEPLALPCSIQQTWADIVPRLKAPALADNSVSMLTLPVSPRQETGEISGYSAKGT